MATTATTSSGAASEVSERDLEEQKTGQKKARHWELVFDQTHITQEVLAFPYKGKGTENEPYVVEYIPNDRRNPMLFPMHKKWFITILVAFATLAVSFVSSAFSSGLGQIMTTFNVGQEVAILGLSLFVLGFAVGPLLWAPMSELYGRQVLFFATYGALTAFNAGAAASQNIQTLLILRFFAGAFGSSPLTNAGGVIADMFPASQRGIAMSIFAAAPFLGPTIGPIVGGFLGAAEGWRWIEGVMAIFTGVLWIVGSLLIPETYSPLILRRRARQMSTMTGKVYKSKIEVENGTKSAAKEFKIALSRPWILLFSEPIVFLLSLYMAIIYGTLYLFFSAMPVVFNEGRGWSPGIGGLSFCGVAVGMIFATIYSLWDNGRYKATNARHNGHAPPEARLPPAIVGSIFLPIGLFWFAWTNYPSIHWSVSIIGTAPFGFGMVLVFLSILNYLIDTYVIYAASVLAANSVLRSLFGAAFPLFTGYMYDNLGIHWASSIPAFLALACVPFPFLFYKYGGTIRMKCKFAAEAARVLEQIRGETVDEDAAEREVEEMEDNEARVLTQTGVADDEKDAPALTENGDDKTLEAGEDLEDKELKSEK